MPEKRDVAARKRQQIDASQKTMFLSVAAAAFLTGIAAVVSIFLVKQVLFHGQVWGAKQETIRTLDTNISQAKELKDAVRALEASEALGAVKLKQDGNALQSVLDALPATANPEALGASLQQKFIAPVEGLTLESLSVEGIGSGDGEQADDLSIGFTMSVSGSAEKLKELLVRFERSIRVITITSSKLTANDKRLTLDITGQAHYEPAQHVNLETKVVKP